MNYEGYLMLPAPEGDEGEGGELDFNWEDFFGEGKEGEEPPIIDAEYTILNGEEGEEVDEGLEERVNRWKRMGLSDEKARKRAAGEVEKEQKLALELEELEVGGGLSAKEAELEYQKWRARKYKRGYRPKRDIGKLVKSVRRTAVPKVLHKELYQFPKLGKSTEPTGVVGMRKLTSPGATSSMRELTMPPGSGKAATPLKALTTPSYGGLQRMTHPSSMKSTPISRLAMPVGSAARASGLNIGLMRKLTTPPNMNQVEGHVYSEVRSNDDVDTVEHVLEELERLGIPKQEAGRAIRALIKRRVITQVDTGIGEPVLEVRR